MIFVAVLTIFLVYLSYEYFLHIILIIRDYWEPRKINGITNYDIYTGLPQFIMYVFVMI